MGLVFKIRYMKTKFTIILSVLLLVNYTYSQTTNGKLVYNFSYNMEMGEINKVLLDIIQKDSLSEESKLVKAYMESVNKIEDTISKKLTKFKDKNHNIYFYKDTVAVNSVDHDLILIPEIQHKYYNKKNGDKFYSYNASISDSLNAGYTVKYTITEDKKDQKEIIGLKGYKIKIVENRETKSMGLIQDVCELYVSNKVNFSFNYYDFLELKKNLNRSGLILEAQCYDNDTPNNRVIYTLSKYNTEVQNRKPITDFVFKKSVN